MCQALPSASHVLSPLTLQCYRPWSHHYTSFTDEVIEVCGHLILAFMTVVHIYDLFDAMFLIRNKPLIFIIVPMRRIIHIAMIYSWYCFG
jgi:hypothetical protein